MYEAHITYRSEHRETVERACPHGWKFSAIDGDPVLGRAVFCYLTSYDIDGRRLRKRMIDTVLALRLEPVREKIEKIVFDTKTGIDEL